MDSEDWLEHYYMTEDWGREDKEIDRCYQCLTGLLEGSKKVGDYLLCRNCYDKMVFEIAQEMGVNQMLADRLEMKEALKKWQKKLNE